ncbi:MAG TPA: DUF2254 family protein [Bacilli bacterium]|nr:DUF2254 family protein [Bacilli bacterium]
MQERIRQMGLQLRHKHQRYAPVSNSIGQLILTVLLMLLIFRWTPPFFAGDLETARNFLSTVAGTLATTLALSISVIMVAIQFNASRYTHRVLDFFVRFPFNASLFTFYLGTILHAIYLMSVIVDHPSDRPARWIVQGMSADMVLLVCCFVSLLIYLYFVIQMLKPEMIVEGIQREYLVAYQQGELQDALEKVEQICDIAKKSVKEMDVVTAVFCVENLAEMMHGARLPSEDADDVLWYHESIVELLIGIASISFKERETAVSGRILDELFEMGMRYAKSGSLQAASTVIDAYALIVRNDLIGQQLMNMIEKAVDQVYTITCQVVKTRAFDKETRAFVLQAFQNLGEIGKLVIKNETYGHNFVAKCIVSHTFGQLLSTLIENGGLERHGLIKVLLFEYMKLAKRLVQRCEMIDIVQVTTWLRNATIPHRNEPQRVQTYLYLFLLLSASALYLRRHDIVMLLIRAVGKYFSPDHELLVGLCKSRIEIRHFFDYHEPERYLIRVYELWQAYHAYSQRYPNGPERKIEFRGSLENEVWQDLFDGLNPNEFLREGRVH